MFKSVTAALRFVALFSFVLFAGASLAEQRQHIEVAWFFTGLGGDKVEGGGTGFLLSKERKIVATAYHVIPAFYPLMKPGMLQVGGSNATLKYAWKEADIAFLHLDRVPAGLQETPIHLAPAAGMTYVSMMTSDILLAIDIPHDIDGAQIVLGGNLQMRGKVLQVTEAKRRSPDGRLSSTGAFYLTTDMPSKQGFSGGPAISDGKVIGIQQGIDGSFGVLSSAQNIHKMLSRPDCK